MNQSTGAERISLSYEGATFKRSLICLAIAVLCFLACWFIHFQPQVPPPGAVAGPPLQKILLGCAGLFLVFYAFFDVIFVIYRNFLSKKIYFDKQHMYIISNNDEISIPFGQVTAVFLVSTAINNGTRGFYFTYRIDYTDINSQHKIYLSVYTKMKNNFETFKKELVQANPSIRIKQWATSLDWLFRR